MSSLVSVSAAGMKEQDRKKKQLCRRRADTR